MFDQSTEIVSWFHTEKYWKAAAARLEFFSIGYQHVFKSEEGKYLGKKNVMIRKSKHIAVFKSLYPPALPR